MVFTDKPHYNQFVKSFNESLWLNSGGVFVLGDKNGDIDSQLAWKVSATLPVSGSTFSPPMLEVSLSSVYSMYKVNVSYIHYDKDEDQFFVWMVCGIYLFSTEVTVSPCYLKLTYS